MKFIWILEVSLQEQYSEYFYRQKLQISIIILLKYKLQYHYFYNHILEGMLHESMEVLLHREISKQRNVLTQYNKISQSRQTIRRDGTDSPYTIHYKNLNLSVQVHFEAFQISLPSTGYLLSELIHVKKYQYSACHFYCPDED